VGSELSAKTLSQFFYEELDAQNWGDIDPYGDIEEMGNCSEATALGEFLERVAKRIREENQPQ
jgi:hypothetical protein